MDRVGEGRYDHVGLRELAVDTLKDGLPGVSLQHGFKIKILLKYYCNQNIYHL